ncbi:MAG: hypothetical protein AAF221_07860 [Pseudomonadota bacterium]
MNQYIEINDGQFIHLAMVKRLRPITEKERDSLSALGKHVDANKFSTRIDRKDGTKTYAQETVDEIASNGIALIQVQNDAFIPRDNIIQAKNISEKDRAGFAERTGRPMPNGFKSEIETKAGKVLCKSDAASVMHSIGYPYQPQTARPQAAEQQTPDAKTASPEMSLAEQRDAVVAKSKPRSKSNGREHPRER